MGRKVKVSDCGWMPARVSLTLLTATGIMVIYMARVNFSITIMEMAVFPDSVSTSASGRAASSCIDAEGTGETGGGGGGKGQGGGGGIVDTTNATSSNITLSSDKLEESIQDPRMVLTGAQQGAVLGSFFYGYVMTQLLGGRAAEIYGTKRVLGITVFAGAIISMLTPLAYSFGYVALIINRVALGIFQGVCYPAISALSTTWIPALERPRFLSASCTANCLGIVLTMPMCGFLIETLGWPSVFYFTGAVSLLWVALWAWLMYDKPEQHPRISPEELEYIQNATRGSNAKAKSALLSAMPFLSRFLGSNIWSWVTDYVLTKELLPVTTCRKIVTFIGLFCAGLAIVGASFVGCNAYLAVGLLSLATFLNGAVVSGYFAAILEMAPNLAGTLTGYGNTLGSVSAFLAPVITGVITANQTAEEWQIAYGLTAILYTVCTFIFLIFGSTTIQPWNFDQGDGRGGKGGKSLEDPKCQALTSHTLEEDEEEHVVKH
ncbi:sialin-like isoform X2 [Oratosquilla oratoria]|uniref:sialin-like isoform X2 n=1 Tax=Oratosquilla oratoria TaxID=337810 RepID=UPI003F768BB1